MMKTIRFHGLDLARAVLMMLGLLYHGAGFYTLGGTSPGDHTIKYIDTSEFFDIIRHLTHSFRMPAFFMIAGFFFAMLLERRTISDSLKNRSQRLLIPMIVMGLTFNLIVLQFQNSNFILDLTYIWENYYSTGEWIRHLWFIGNLLGYYIITIAIFPVLKRINVSLQSYCCLYVFVLPLLVALTERISSFFYTENFAIFSFGRNFYHLYLFFLAGFLAWNIRDQILSIKSGRIIFILATLSLPLIFLNYFFKIEFLPWLLLRYVEIIGITALSAGVILALNKAGQKKSSFTKVIVDSSYSIYLFHLPINLVFFVTVQKHLALSLPLSFMLQITFVFLSTLALHYFFVRSNKLMSLLYNGK